VNPYAAAVTATNYTYHLIADEGNKDIYWFQTVMQGQFDLGLWGVHTGGHFTIGGDPGGVGALFISHLRILFYLNHSSPRLPLPHSSLNWLTWQDFFASPGDPAFFLHHGMIDRTWWVWQMQNLSYSLSAVSGTLTIFNTPPSRNATLDDDIDLGYVRPGETKKLGDLLDTMGGNDGQFCYIYV